MNKATKHPFFQVMLCDVHALHGWLHPLNLELIYLFAIVNSTLSIPLGTAWTNATLNMTDIAKSGAPALIREAMWIDAARQLINVWGGAGATGSTDANDTHNWELTVDGSGGGSWKFEDLESPSQMAGLQRAAGGAAATCYNTGFYLGGYTTTQNGTDILVPGLLTYNMTSQAWANESAAPFTTHGTSMELRLYACSLWPARSCSIFGRPNLCGRQLARCCRSPNPKSWHCL